MHSPDYILIGAMKSGTTTLAAQLGAQEGLFMTTPKEPNYFSDDDIFANGPEWYADLFRPADADDLKGEASTHYTKLPTYPQTITRLRAGCGARKFIYLIRNPLDRAVSHYIHEWTQGVISETTSLDDAVDSLPEIVSYGQYGMQMAAWLAHFDRSQIHIESLETMKAAPQDTLDRVGAFLGRTDLRWNPDLGQENQSAERLRTRSLDKWILHSAPATWLRRTLVPQSIRDKVKAKRRMATRPAFSADMLRHLQDVFAQDRALLHSQFPDRPDLDVCYPFCTSDAAK